VAVRVRLCAIAKNEGAYLADWVFHHLHFGFDGVEVFVNGTVDPSRRILRKISKVYPHVSGVAADRLVRDCVAVGAHFQEQAYARLARRAKRAGFTHVAFLDLDEYWTPTDFRSSIKDFLPDDPGVNVVSFPWALDIPDVDRPAFTLPWASREKQVQLERHVKSVVNMNGSVRHFRAHTARTRRCVHLLVREPFPLEDRVAQRRGAFVTDDFLRSHWDRLPEAFVLHAINRSTLEYVAAQAQGTRETGQVVTVKGGRIGFVPTAAPVLAVSLPRRAHKGYQRARRRFRKRVAVDQAVVRAQRLVAERARRLLAEADDDAALAAELVPFLHGVPLDDLRRQLRSSP
jgi:hypothetical protein